MSVMKRTKETHQEMYSCFNRSFSHSNGNPLIFDRKSQTVKKWLVVAGYFWMLNIATAAAVWIAFFSKRGTEKKRRQRLKKSFGFFRRGKRKKKKIMYVRCNIIRQPRSQISHTRMQWAALFLYFFVWLIVFTTNSMFICCCIFMCTSYFNLMIYTRSQRNVYCVLSEWVNLCVRRLESRESLRTTLAMEMCVCVRYAEIQLKTERRTILSNLMRYWPERLYYI